MNQAAGPDLLPNKWDDAVAAGLDGPGRLLYRSNLLGSDLRVTNFGGGNTSSKIDMTDPLTGEAVKVLWVKGSGGDVGTMKLDGFATLYQDKLLALQARYRGIEQEDEMVGLYPHATFNLNARAASIDTPLHGLVDKVCVDHMHPDAVIAIAAARDSQRLTKEIFGDEIGWLPWLRPGFELGMRLKQFVEANPNAKGLVLESHGLFTWGDDDKACYSTTIEVINKAIAYLHARGAGQPAFGGEAVQSLDPDKRRAIAAALMPRIRGLISQNSPKVGHFNDSEVVLQFVNSTMLGPLASLGTACPDHFLRTKISPLVLAFDPAKEGVDDLLPRLESALSGYRDMYGAYYARCKRANSPDMRDPNAVVYLVPGVGMITFAADKATARISGEFYVNAINVMRDATILSEYQGLPEQEAFDIEYWLLEEAKLQRMPKPKALAGRIAVITGGAGGIGLASARRLAQDGACVVLADIDREAVASAEAELKKAYGKDVIASVWIDVTNEQAVAFAFEETCVRFGGADIAVSNAGIASAATIGDTPLALWDKNISILLTGYFLFSRSAINLMKAQNMGGSIVYIGSKNALVASPGAGAYCTAKGGELHLARCLALEGADFGVRVNVVNPDAVLRGSRIWQGEWAEQRAAQYKTSTEDLERIYRERSLLKRSVYPEDIAEAVAFLAGDVSAKSTGNIINVDAGNAAAFTR